jgi:hypothetical protein
MPTVKLHSSGKAILKDGKVSCTCCAAPETCCMYPAAGLGDTYEAADLLDSILLNVTPGVDFTFSSLLLNKVTPITEGDYTYYFTGEADGEEAGVGIDTTAPEWVVASKGPSGFSPVTSLGSCLITGDGNLTPGDDAVEDQFADTYTVSATLASPEPNSRTDAHSRQTPRLSLCSWSYSGEQEDPGNFTFILNVIFDPTLQKWVGTYVLDSDNFGTAYFIKDDPQNTPVGTYTLDSFFDLSSDNPDEGSGSERRYDYTGTFTVSEP